MTSKEPPHASTASPGRIAWTDETWNPLIGCDRLTRECLRCYAEPTGMGMVRKTGGNTPYAEVVRLVGGEPRWTGVVRRNSDRAFFKMRAFRAHAAKAAAGLVLRKRVFLNSMLDLFHEKAVASGLTRQVIDELLADPGHDYQILTKRADLTAAYYASDPRIHEDPDIWLGVSVGIVEAKHRIDVLRTIPALMKFVSAEPVLEDLADIDLTGVHWVIGGGESGPGCRPCDPEWLRGVRDRCVAQGVPFFLKQLGGHPDKRAHGKAVLDGETWTQFPSRPAPTRPPLLLTHDPQPPLPPDGDGPCDAGPEHAPSPPDGGDCSATDQKRASGPPSLEGAARSRSGCAPRGAGRVSAWTSRSRRTANSGWSGWRRRRRSPAATWTRRPTALRTCRSARSRRTTAASSPRSSPTTRAPIGGGPNRGRRRGSG